MDRLEKIGTVLVMIALIGVLVYSFRPRMLPGVRLNTSASPRMTGPSYLTAALPIRRINDDYAETVSEPY